MRRFAILVFIFFMVSASTLLFAQTGSSAGTTAKDLDKSGSIRSQSDYYPVNLNVTKVFSNSLGYRVVYRKGEVAFADVFIPVAWFVPGGKAQLLPGRGASLPYLVVYFKSDGAFSHLKLFVQEDRNHSSWGQLTGEVTEKFKVETIKLQY